MVLEIVPEYTALIWILCCKRYKVYEVRFFHIFGIGINDFNIGSINTEDDTALERQSFSRMNISIYFVHNWLATWRITLYKDFQNINSSSRLFGRNGSSGRTWEVFQTWFDHWSMKSWLQVWQPIKKWAWNTTSKTIFSQTWNMYPLSI